jgi:hypothetical protein
MLEWIGHGLRSQMLAFPDSNSPIQSSIDTLCVQERDRTPEAGQIASG